MNLRAQNVLTHDVPETEVAGSRQQEKSCNTRNQCCKDLYNSNKSYKLALLM